MNKVFYNDPCDVNTRKNREFWVLARVPTFHDKFHFHEHYLFTAFNLWLDLFTTSLFLSLCFITQKHRTLKSFSFKKPKKFRTCFRPRRSEKSQQVQNLNPKPAFSFTTEDGVMFSTATFVFSCVFVLKPNNGMWEWRAKSIDGYEG